ncbi:MAG: sulfurtransferase TusA family protein [Rhodospirillales bacterium]|nr:sulfurtransferase TusA family protein [Rhodospirillales bacterium]MDH3965941.1 sulfurtransferase TusA family protein [Rhodospirillales bacterium]
MKKTGATQILNIKGVNCPMPVMWARTQLDSLEPGQTLEILATDPSALSNFQSFARTTGHELVEHSEDGGVIHLLIRKTA